VKEVRAASSTPNFLVTICFQILNFKFEIRLSRSTERFFTPCALIVARDRALMPLTQAPN
jgi:hypothetical protein